MPKIQIPAKLLPFFEKSKRYKIAIGGRGSGKSMTIADIQLQKAATNALKILCMREFQSSIKDSSYALLKDEVGRVEIPGYNWTLHSINHESGGEFAFKGLARSIESIKSFHGFDIGSIEEAQFLSDESIRILKPTFRSEGSEIWMAANPGSSEDPFSKEFLNPYWDKIIKDGYYEDSRRIIVHMNYYDNPFFPQVLEEERKEDYERLPRALYDWIWLGMFNDSVESSLIQAEWFDACIDAHKKLGIEPRGAIIAAHDPSDVGPDNKGYAARKGILLTRLEEKTTGDVNEGGDWATGLATQDNADYYNWDCDGLGVGLNSQTKDAFYGKHTVISQFKGSESPDFPDSVFEPDDKSPVRGQKLNKDVFRNKRAQYYYSLRQRMYNTYLAVVKGKYIDPDKLFSLDSSIKLLPKLRSEVCRMPVKPNRNGLIELYTKEEMKVKFKFPSPNLADSVMMLMRYVNRHDNNIIVPKPIPIMGIGARR